MVVRGRGSTALEVGSVEAVPARYFAKASVTARSISESVAMREGCAAPPLWVKYEDSRENSYSWLVVAERDWSERLPSRCSLAEELERPPLVVEENECSCLSLSVLL